MCFFISSTWEYKEKDHIVAMAYYAYDFICTMNSLSLTVKTHVHVFENEELKAPVPVSTLHPKKANSCCRTIKNFITNKATDRDSHMIHTCQLLGAYRKNACLSCSLEHMH